MGEEVGEEVEVVAAEMGEGREIGVETAGKVKGVIVVSR